MDCCIATHTNSVVIGQGASASSASIYASYGKDVARLILHTYLVDILQHFLFQAITIAQFLFRV